MKKSFFVLFSLLFVAGISFGQKAPASPDMTTESSNVSIKYAAPSKKGRDIFGALVPYGKVWRTGANAATTVTFKKDVTFGGVKVKAGTYALFTIPGEKEWSVILNSVSDQWGSGKYDEKKNVAEVKVKAAKNKAVVEQMNITATDKSISISWDTASVSVPLKF